MAVVRRPVLACLCLYAAALAAGEVTDFQLSHREGVYHLDLTMVLDAPADSVYHVLTDYVHIYRLNPAIVESRVMPAPDDSVARVKTLTENCILFFCRDILRVEDVRELGNGIIRATIVPRLSNVRSGTTVWQIQPLGRRTRIDLELVLEPGFFVPPLIGSYLVRQKLREEAVTTLNNAERLAAMLHQPEDAGRAEPRNGVPRE